MYNNINNKLSQENWCISCSFINRSNIIKIFIKKCAYIENNVLIGDVKVPRIPRIPFVITNIQNKIKTRYDIGFIILQNL